MTQEELQKKEIGRLRKKLLDTQKVCVLAKTMNNQNRTHMEKNGLEPKGVWIL